MCLNLLERCCGTVLCVYDEDTADDDENEKSIMQSMSDTRWGRENHVWQENCEEKVVMIDDFDEFENDADKDL